MSRPPYPCRIVGGPYAHLVGLPATVAHDDGGELVEVTGDYPDGRTWGRVVLERSEVTHES